MNKFATNNSLQLIRTLSQQMEAVNNSVDPLDERFRLKMCAVTTKQGQAGRRNLFQSSQILGLLCTNLSMRLALIFRALFDTRLLRFFTSLHNCATYSTNGWPPTILCSIKGWVPNRQMAFTTHLTYCNQFLYSQHTVSLLGISYCSIHVSFCHPPPSSPLLSSVHIKVAYNAFRPCTLMFADIISREASNLLSKSLLHR